MPHRIQVVSRDEPESRRVVAAAPSLGVHQLEDCRFARVTHLFGPLGPVDVERLCSEVLVDPIVDEFEIGWDPEWSGPVVEVTVRPGVTDAEARAVEAAAEEIGIDVHRAVTVRRYELSGTLAPADVELLARRLLVNDTIETWTPGTLPAEPERSESGVPAVETIGLRGCDRDALLEVSRSRSLALDADEMTVIAEHFASENRDPTDAELETLAQTWSEHCVHKTFRASIELTHVRDGRDQTRTVDGLLARLRAATEELDPPWLRSAFVDNAGIVEFDDDLDLAVKVETHNHPSALEPFGGANTGVGGVVRDIIGVSARPIACTDVLCFGPPDTDQATVPDGVLHPRRVRDGVIAGVGDYGNKLGLPTVNGAVLYDAGYIANPLVFCGAVGVLPRGSHPTSPGVGDRIVVIGGRTGRDGIRGATFSSAGMDATTAHAAGSAVQIGDPITEKGCIEVVERARDMGLYTAITDCGAGGFSSAVGEMAADLGAAVDLARAPLKYDGLAPWEIWLSEAQERMVLAVPPANVVALAELCRVWDVELTDLGEITGSGRLVVTHGTTPVVDLSMRFLHDGLPRRRSVARWVEPDLAPVTVPGTVDTRALLLDLLAHPDVASKEEVVRTYDHEVRGGTAARPLVGVEGDGPGDAAVVKPLGTWHHHRAIALSVGINPRLGRIDPWAMALAAVDEAVRNLVAVGADPDRVALLDNFCWGDPSDPERLGALVRSVEGCVEASLRYRMPFISGKDSLNNQFEGRSIPDTLLISAVGTVPDLTRVVTSGSARAGDDVWLVGTAADELGGSLVADLLGLGPSAVPAPLEQPLPAYRAVHGLISEGLISAAHDCSEGGVAVAVAEMAIGARSGMSIHLPGAGDPVRALFNEAPGRIVLTAPADGRHRLQERLDGLGARVGEVTGGDRVQFSVGRDTDAPAASGIDRLALHTVEIALSDALAAFGGRR